MARRYQNDELLRLRESPLVCKPPGLPAIEAWMGAPPEQNQRKPALNRAKTDDPASQKDLTASRPSFLENRRQSKISGTVPTDIILGPPKTAFASASAARNSTKPIDSPGRSAFGPLTGGMGRSEVSTPKERPQSEKDKRGDEDEVDRGTRLAYTNGKRGEKDDKDWESLRSGKNFGLDDNGHRGFGRFSDRDDTEKPESWTSKRQTQKGFEAHRWVDDTPGMPRNGNARNGKSSWYRDQETQNSQEPEASKDVRTRGWRDGEKANRRGQERDRNSRPFREESAPEWMESEPVKDSTAENGRRTHTADDIEKWKASMRASKENAAPPASAPDVTVTHEPLVSGKLFNGKNGKLDKPLGMDPAFDSFLGLWSQPDLNSISAKDAQEKTTQEVPQMRPLKPSKFTGFFNPKPLTMPTNPNPETEPPATAPPTINNSSSEDKEGFQRILQMLGGATGNVKSNENGNSGGAEPSIVSFSQQGAQNQQQNPGENRKTPPREPTREASAQRELESPPIHSPRSRRSLGLENLLGMQPSRDNHNSQDRNSNSDFFLSLLQQPNDKAFENPQNMSNHQNVTSAPINLSFTAPMQQQQHHHQMQQNNPQNVRLDFHHAEPLSMDFRSRDKLNPNLLQNAKRPLDQYDEPAIITAHQRHPQQQPPHSTGLAHLPPGLHRPPGFDQLPPNYAHHMQPQNPHHPRMPTMPAPPPGFPTQPQPPRQNPSQFPPGLLPSLSALNLSSHNANNERAIPYPMRTQNLNGLNSPVQPPPGFMMMQNGGGGGGPPQGFFPQGIHAQQQQQEGGRMSPTRGNMFFVGGQGQQGGMRPEGYEGRGLPMGMWTGPGMPMGGGFRRE